MKSYDDRLAQFQAEYTLLLAQWNEALYSRGTRIEGYEHLSDEETRAALALPAWFLAWDDGVRH